MKIVDGTWSVVVVGKWNRYILTPGWVSKKIFRQEKIEVQFPVNKPELAPRYISQNNIIFMPAIHNSKFIAQQPYDDEMLVKMSAHVKRLVTILEHTPVSAIGVNFGFEEDSHNFGQLDMFTIIESDKFLDKGFITNSTEIKRQLPIDNHFLNLSVVYSKNKIHFDFNFHYNVTTPKEIAELATDNLLIYKKEKALEIMHDVYKLELESDEEES